MRKLLLLAIAVAVSAMATSAAQANQPGSVTCEGFLTDPMGYANVVVPAGGWCALQPSEGYEVLPVTGNVSVGPGSRAYLDFVEIDGNVESHGAELLYLKGEVTGNVTTTGGGLVGISSSIIGGNLRVSGNDGAQWGFVDVSGVEVGGNLEFNDNTAFYQYLYANTVAKNLSCEGNDPVP